MIDTFLSALFGSTGFVYGLLIPMLIAQMLLLVLIPGLLNSGARAKSVAQAAYCYLMEALGIVLMTLGAVPTIYSILAGFAFAGTTYIALLFLFAVGGGMYLWHDQLVQSLDSASVMVPKTIFTYLLKILGHLAMLFGLLSIFLTLIIGVSEAGWWISPLLMTVYGVLLSWCTRDELNEKNILTSIAMPKMSKPAIAAAAPKATASKAPARSKKKR